jgi:hypothetical protein
MRIRVLQYAPSHIVSTRRCSATLRVVKCVNGGSENYPGRWIGWEHEALFFWPACPPDLNLLDFILWRYLETEFYASAVGTREELCRRIQQFGSEITNTHGVFESLQVPFSR